MHLAANSSRQQLAIDDVGRRHLAFPFKNGDVLVRRLAVIGVVLRVRGDALPVRSAEMVNLARQLS